MTTVGSSVKHIDHPGEVGLVQRIVFVGKKTFYKVQWPSGGSGSPALYSKDNVDLIEV